MTLADNEIETHITVTPMANCDEPGPDTVRYSGTNDSQMIHVVYIVKPIYFDSLNASGIARVSTAYAVHTQINRAGYVNDTRHHEDPTQAEAQRNTGVCYRNLIENYLL